MTYNSSDQEESIKWARRMLEGNFAILDTETTGLGDNAEIVQIGILNSDGQTYQRLVKPTISISEGAFQIHGISNKDVAEALDFEHVFLEAWRFLKSRDLIVYNADFDLKIIRNSLKARGIQIAFPTSDRRSLYSQAANQRIN